MKRVVMEISLQFIKEKLKLTENDTTLMTLNNHAFSDILLLSNRTNTLKTGVLYVGESYPHESIVFEQGCGLCLQNEQKELPCDVLFVTNTIPFEELFNQVSQIFSQLRKQIENLMQVIYEKKGLQPVIEIISQICEHPVYLVDSSFKVLAIKGENSQYQENQIWRTLIDDGYLSFDLVVYLIESNEFYSIKSGFSADLIISEVFGRPFINYNMRYKEKLQGHLFIIGVSRDISPGDIELANILGPLVLQGILTDPNFQTTRGKYYEHFIIDMIEGNPMKPERMHKQVKTLHFDMDSNFAVAKIIPLLDNELIAEQIARQLENFNGSKPVQYKGSIITVFPLDINENAYEAYSLLVGQLRDLSNNLNCIIGISDMMHGFTKITLEFIQASAAIDLGKKLRHRENLYRYQDYVIYHPFLNFEQPNDLMTMCHPGILDLFNFDMSSNTSFLSTFEAYLDHERHSLLTATKLHIHRHTLTYRLERINEICQFNLDDVLERKRIIISIEILNYLNQITDSEIIEKST